jgi:hypothetical protein
MSCDHGFPIAEQCAFCYAYGDQLMLPEGRLIGGKLTVTLSASASRQLAEIASQSTIKNGLTYAQRMRRKAEEARRRHS